MRINMFIARATGISRRAADDLVASGRVRLNRQPAGAGQQVGESDMVTLDGAVLELPAALTTIMLHKPAGYVCSRNGQGSPTVYELLPAAYRALKPVGRLDKDSSGLLLLTNDGRLANRLAHPRYAKEKLYEVSLDKPLAPADRARLERGVAVEDYVSRLKLAPRRSGRGGGAWQVTLTGGRNRQIRRTFAALGYSVTRLHRTQFGPYRLAELPPGGYAVLPADGGPALRPALRRSPARGH